jgi:hypothetical protein
MFLTGDAGEAVTMAALVGFALAVDVLFLLLLLGVRASLLVEGDLASRAFGAVPVLLISRSAKYSALSSGVACLGAAAASKQHTQGLEGTQNIRNLLIMLTRNQQPTMLTGQCNML